MCLLMSDEEIGNIVDIFLYLSRRVTAEAKRVIFVIVSITKCSNKIDCYQPVFLAVC